jgi:ASPIC/UnbV protein/Ser-Thr-rich glycosyl-phosphatidyl-inositol-anchored membrane family protein
LQGVGPPLSNRDGIGAKIKVTTPDGIVQYWETRSGDSLGGGSGLRAGYFGLNDNTLVSQVQVTWPSGIVQIATGLGADQRMTIAEPSAPPNITVTGPNGGETWIKGNTYTLTWTDNISGNVKIRLLNGSATAAIIAASTPSDGSFDWTIPPSLASGRNYKVEVLGLDDPTIRDQSDRSFRIR